jgi:hypothetical protein
MFFTPGKDPVPIVQEAGCERRGKLNKQEFPANISDSAAKYERDFD